MFVRRSSSEEACLAKAVETLARRVSGLFAENQMIDQLDVDGLGGLP
jgi:hypothetical protein